MVLQKPLDREKQNHISLLLTAIDGGEPQMSGTMQIFINVLDANDNAPTFAKPLYRAKILENSPKGTSISDVNDNAPVFERSSYEAYIVENNTPGLSVFTVKARDADWNQNARVSYILEDSSVNGVPVSSYVSVSADSGVIHAVRSFDYEQIKDFHFRVKAQDGGSPPLSSNVTVKILIQDQNDNPPQVLYPVQTGGSLVAELVPRSADVGYLVTKVVAVDVDSGQNAWLSYKLQKATDRALFEVGSQNGEIRTIRQVTDKDAVKQRLSVIVEDNGQPSRSATVVVNVAVVDSFPEVLSEFTDFTHDKEYNDNLTFYLVLALAVVSFLFITCVVVIISVKIYRWRQSRVLYHSNLPVIPYYPPRYSDTLGTGTLQHVYNYEVCRTTDSRKSDCKFSGAGSQNVLIMDPSSTGTMQRIQSEKNILDEPDSPLEISDVNDNAPVFERSSYEAYIVENNTPGLSVFTVKARDADWNQNARVSYILEDSSVNGVPVSSYVSVSADSGVIHAVRSFDYEQIKDFHFRVKAQDGGSPPLSSNVTVKILIQDQNDNPPQVLYPVQTGVSLVAEMVPRSADVGYLVTKVVAVDVDSGQNAWLSYKLQKATDRALFEVGSQNGEIRTIRQVTDKDAVKQRLSVIVEDNGQPSRSATVVVNVAVADSFPEVLSEFTDFTHDKEYNDNLTFYLVLALAVVSFLFITCVVVIISVKIYRWRQSRVLYHSNLPVIPYYPPRYSDTLGTGTLQHVYNYEVCRTTDSRKSDCKFSGAGSQNVLIMDPSSTGTMQRIQSERSILDEPDSPLEDLGVDMKRLKSGRARIHSGDSAEYIELNRERGVLVIKERVDRETLCGETTPCAVHLQMILENPMELFRITIEITDINDNAPSFASSEKRFEISESAVIGSKFVLEKAVDADIGENGLQSYSLNPTDNFALKLENQADGSKKVEMVLQKPLDREQQEQISLLLTALDGGKPHTILEDSPDNTVIAMLSVNDPDSERNGEISDVNDNAPVFERSSYQAYIVENNTPGLSVFTVRARDADWNQNARVSYILEDSSVNGVPVSSYVSVSADSGVIHAVRSFDYEQIKDFHFRVKAQDGGSPPLSSNVTVKILIQDQNDNPPQVLYPVQTGGSLVAELVPRSADVGYLVTKVVAVDVDSGQNAWLSYKLQKATDRALFEVGSQNGEIRTIRQVTDKDAVKQRLNVIVEDNGQPSRSATVVVNVAVADSFPEVLSEFTDFTHDKEYNDNLTFYLVLALAVVSFLFITCVVVIISVKIYRWRQSRVLYHSNLPVIPYYPPRYSDTLGTGTLQHVYNYEVCRTTDSRKSDCKISGAGSQNVLIMDPSATGTMQRIQSEKSILDEPDSPLEVSYSIPEEMAKASLVGNIAQDLGLDVKRLRSGKARIYTGDSAQYIELNRDRGVLLVKDKIDREALCRQTTPCALHFQITLENPLELFPVTVEITDINDNAPLFQKEERRFEISESAVIGSKFLLEKAIDPDIGVNGLQTYTLKPSENFALKLHSQSDGSKKVEMVLQKPLDREKQEHIALVLTAEDGGEPQRTGTMQIHVTVLDANDNAPVFMTCSDEGVPSLSSSVTLTLQIADVNDNAPVFERSSYEAYIVENNTPGLSVFTVKARDADWNQNARVSYILEDSSVNGVPVSSYVSVSADSGVIHAVRSFDYEQIKDFHFRVKAQDGGSPPLSSNVTVKILIQDQNDNPPQVLYPVQTGGSLVAEMVPRSADVGYLVTKVVAVDVDSGQNAWLSYKLQKATDRALFEVGSQNGEIRTIRQVTDKDAVKQRLSVIVEDNGQPSRSATVVVNVAVADSFPEVLSEFTDFTHDKEYNDNLTFYLVLALAVVSFLFITCVVVIISVKIYRWRQSRVLYHSNLPVIPYYPPRYSDTLGTGTLQHVYNYEVCRTTDSRKSDCKFSGAGSQNVLIMDPSSTGTMQRIQSEKSILDEPDSPLEVTYSVNEELSVGSVVGNVAEDLGLDVERLKSRNARVYLVTCSDEGVPSLSSSVTLTLQISDVNDNAPVFERSSYEAYIVENNTPGLSVFTVKARDADWNQNARVSYILEDSSVNGVPISSYVSVSADSGVIHAVRSFDYEQIKDFHFRVKAQDGGSPPLNSNVTVKILIQDQNDNPPQVLYPVQTGGSLVAELVPRSADVGYLVTKVVAVDVDSGQNAWLSYKLQKATDRALFEVGSQNGEIRTIRQVTDKDAVKQRLSVIVEDNGQPSRSATVVVNVAVADSFPEVLSEFTDFTHDKEYNDNLTFYLVLALAVVSFLFITCVVVIISVKIYRWRQSRVLYHSNLPVIPYYPPRYSDTLGTGTLQHVYNYEVCRTTDSRKSDCKFSGAGSQNVLIMDPSSTGTMQRIQNEKSILDEPDSPLEVRPTSLFSVLGQVSYSIPEEMAKGSLVGNIAQDLGVDVKRLQARRARIHTGDSTEYIQLNREKGLLVIKERIDREALCGQTTPCALHFQIALESPIEIFPVTVEITDINDNAPVFQKDEKNIEISESAVIGSKFISVTLTLQISDVNDNAPVFERSSYEANLVENNTPGLSVFTVKARDADWNQNARVSYILEDSSVNGVPLSSYVSVSADSGVIHAVRSFDYEQIKDFHFRVKAQDGGSPPLSSNVTVKILIQDQNDNPPQVLYPVQTGGSLVAEMVPRSADVGYLVTKVVAVDVDSGQNAWLSYKLQKARDRALFEVGSQNGEIRTIRQVTDKDAVKQRLSVIVEDNGQPSRSATVVVNVAVVDSFPEVLSEFTDFTHDKEYNDNLTFYLVLALAVVSFLFITCVVVIISVKIYRWRQSRVLYHSNLPVIPYYPPRYSDTLGTGTLQHVYNYEVCRTTDSRKSDCKFSGAGSHNVLIMDPSATGTMQRIQSEKSILDEPDSPLE
ncbi:unnamed protein product, partial [Pleuronectes platessa]